MTTWLVAPDKFGGACSALDAALAIAAGLRDVRPDDIVLLRPLADGGEGLADVLTPLATAIGTADVRDPHGIPRPARLLELGTRLIVESADACGLRHLDPGALRPWDASSAGVGDLVQAGRAWRPDARLCVGLGGSGTVDGGIGLFTALGAVLRDRYGAPLAPDPRALDAVHRVDLDAVAPIGPCEAWSDVDAPLLPTDGAPVSCVDFAAQKGVAPADRARLTEGWSRWADALARSGVSVDPHAPGTGAAGGLGFALLALGASLRSGADAVLDAIGFDDALTGADRLITGEGSFDAQSLAGKGPGVALARARAAGVPAVVLAGRVRLDPVPPDAIAITPPGEPLPRALAATLPRLRAAVAALASRDAP